MVKTNYSDLLSQRDSLLQNIKLEMKKDRGNADPWDNVANAMFPPMIDFMSKLLDVVSKNETALLEMQTKLQTLAAATAVAPTSGTT